MNNRESLELAAKAAGIKHKGIYCNEKGLCVGEDSDGYDVWWNPRKNSEDALNLATILNINIYEAVCWYYNVDEYSTDDGGDKGPKETTCEAIVLTAAIKGLNKDD